MASLLVVCLCLLIRLRVWRMGILTFAPPFYPLRCLAWIFTLFSPLRLQVAQDLSAFPIRCLILCGGSPSNSTTLIARVFTDFHFSMLRIPIGCEAPLVSAISRKCPYLEGGSRRLTREALGSKYVLVHWKLRCRRSNGLVEAYDDAAPHCMPRCAETVGRCIS